MKKDIKKEKKVIVSILIVVALLILILVAFRLNVFSGFSIFSNGGEYEERFIYHDYKQICSQDESYFENLAWLIKGDSKKIREIKFKSAYCDTTDVRNITKAEFEDIECECLERNWRRCQEGWVFRDGFCYKGDSFTNSIKVCSFYKCEGNHFVEVYKKEN
tara:strand:+ start:501 stop:983 length:483 start_codon:yes stop_codon:yes gene_type:complete